MTSTIMKDSRVPDEWLRGMVQSNPAYEVPDAQNLPSGQFNSGPVRLFYPHLDQPQVNRPLPGQPVNPNAKAKYQATLHFPPIAYTQPLIDAAVRIICQNKGWDPRMLPPDMITRRSIGGIPTPFHDGFEKQQKAGYTPGGLYFNVATTNKPPVKYLHESGQLMDVPDPSFVYSGCWAIASFDLYFMKAVPQTQIAERLCAGLKEILLLGKEDNVIGTGTRPSIPGSIVFSKTVGAMPIRPPAMAAQPQTGWPQAQPQPQPQQWGTPAYNPQAPAPTSGTPYGVAAPQQWGQQAPAPQQQWSQQPPAPQQQWDQQAPVAQAMPPVWQPSTPPPQPPQQGWGEPQRQPGSPAALAAPYGSSPPMSVEDQQRLMQNFFQPQR